MAFMDAMGEAIPISLRELSATDKPGDLLEVFLWTDRKLQLRATRQKPLVQNGIIAFLRVSHVAQGVGFVSIGVDEDIPIFREYQESPIEEGKRYYMTLLYSEKEQRTVLTTRIANMLQHDAPYKQGQQVRFMILEKIEQGRVVVVDGKYRAFVHKNDVLPGVKRGEEYIGYVRDNRRDGLYVSMHKPGREKVEEAADKIMEMLLQHRGYLRLTDNTPAEEIQLRLRMSKGTFKSAIGKLYKERKVELTPRGIKLVK
jgi:predicted RNA-binding protein (virulence factor B family)